MGGVEERKNGRKGERRSLSASFSFGAPRAECLRSSIHPIFHPSILPSNPPFSNSPPNPIKIDSCPGLGSNGWQ